jgi:flagellar hook assembly protein FlgD
MNQEETFIGVWRQVLIAHSRSVEIGEQSFRVVSTSKLKLRQVNFQFDGRDIRGIEQNPMTKSRWAKMAREGKKVMQFTEQGRYVAVVVDGKYVAYKR